MSQTRYFYGTEQVNFTGHLMPNADFARSFPGVSGVKYDGYKKLVAVKPSGEVVPITRRIYRKANPSNHKCDARCRNAKGFNCECSCGGRYHGAGG